MNGMIRLNRVGSAGRSPEETAAGLAAMCEDAAEGVNAFTQYAAWNSRGAEG